jgi:periplasmic protein TonB
MNDTSRGIGASLLIHGALMGLFVLLNTVWVAEPPRVKIDLGILRTAGGPAAPASAPPAPVKRRAPAQPAVQPEAVSTAAAPSPDVQEYPGPPAPAGEEAGGGAGEAAASAAGGGGAGPADEASQRAAYVNEYFLFIKERIVRNLVFPPAARRMGWSGKVLISFIVCRDGQVSEIRIVESTGYPVLDRSAVDTIRKVAPFPKAPVEAELTMPIVYRLL